MNGVSWWRRPSVLGAIAGALVIAAIAAIVLGSDESEPRQLAVRAGTTTTSAAETTTTSVDETTTTTAAEGSSTVTTRRTTTTRAAAGTVPPAPTTTAPRSNLPAPPAAAMRSTDGEVAGERGSYCWRNASGPSLCADSADVDPDQTLRVKAGSSVEIRWAIEEQPEEVQAKYTQSNQWLDFNPPLPRSNPTSFRADFTPGVHTIAVFSVWSQGDVTYYFKVDIY